MICPATMLSSGVTAVILTHNRPAECARRVRNTAEALREGTGRIFAVNNGTASIPIPPSIGAIPESDAWRRNLSSVGLTDLAGEKPADPEAIILPDEHVFSALVR